MEKEEKTDKHGNGEIDEMMVIPTTKKGEALFSRKPKKAIEEMKELVQIISSQCVGPAFIAEIGTKRYPKVEWWTTVGATLGLFPVVKFARRIDREDDEVIYEARVEVRHGDKVIAAGEALCSDREGVWAEADEYAIKSMSITRATGKAYRIPLSFLAVMGGLCPTNAEEVPLDGDAFGDGATEKQISYIVGLCEEKYPSSDIFLHLKAKYNKDELEELTREEASQLIDHLLANRELLTPEERV